MGFALTADTERVLGLAFRSHTIFRFILYAGYLSLNIPVNVCLQNRTWPGMSRRQTMGSLWGDRLLSLPPHLPSVEGWERRGVGAGVESDEKCL